jgi:hypothetical protein
MISPRQASRVCGLILFALCCVGATAQSEAGSIMERTFPYSAEAVNKALEQVGGFRGGTLPMVEGFVAVNLADLERYQRPYYQFRVHLNPAEANSTVLQVEARISAWYADPDPSRSEYRSLPSNGRLEADLLARLGEVLAPPKVGKQAVPAVTSPNIPPALNSSNARTSTANAGPAFSKSQFAPATQEQLDAILAERQSVQAKTASLLAQIQELKSADQRSSQGPKLASVKRSGVGVMSRMNFGGPVMFRAQAEDEFEVIDLESGWAHVRLGPDSTAYIQADELVLPAGLAEKNATAEASGPSPSVKPTDTPEMGFWVSREEVDVFSGDWTRLKGKKVLFVYAQPRGFLSDMAGDDARLAYAKKIFQTKYEGIGQGNVGYDGVVVVFLGSKGGVAAATLTDIRQWVHGDLGDSAFVSRCSLDPPGEFKRISMN